MKMKINSENNIIPIIGCLFLIIGIIAILVFATIETKKNECQFHPVKLVSVEEHDPSGKYVIVWTQCYKGHKHYQIVFHDVIYYAGNKTVNPMD
jgi:hypothetical protein